MYTQAGPQFLEELNRHHLPAAMVIVGQKFCIVTQVNKTEIFVTLNSFLTESFLNIKEHMIELFLKCLFVKNWLQLRDINARVEKIEPKIHSSDAIVSNYSSTETKPTMHNPKKSSPKAKTMSRENSLFGGQYS